MGTNHEAVCINLASSRLSRARKARARLRRKNKSRCVLVARTQ